MHEICASRQACKKPSKLAFCSSHSIRVDALFLLLDFSFLLQFSSHKHITVATLVPSSLSLSRWGPIGCFLCYYNSCSTRFFFSTLFENYSKCRICIFEVWPFPSIFVLLKLTCLVTLFDRKLQVFKNLPKWNIFDYFLSTQNVNLARFARTVEWDFFCDFG